MLFYLICSASASLVSGGHIDLSAFPDLKNLHEDRMDTEVHEQKLRDELHNTILGVHQNVVDNLDAPEVPHGNDPKARIKALLEAFHQHPPVTADEEAPAAPAIEDLAAEEKPKAGLAGKEAEALAKIGQSLKTMVMMHVVMKPMLEKLTLVAEHAQGKAKEAAVNVLKEMAAMDMYSEKAAQMLGVIQKASKGTPEQQMKAIKMLEVGLMMIKQGMHKHMMAMKALTHKPAAAPAGGATGKMEAVVQEMQAKVDAEIMDPKRKGDPMVGLDVMMLKALKKAVAKSEALEQVTKEESQKHPEKAQLYAKALKVGLHKVAEELKTEMEGLKKKALVMMIMMKMMKDKEAAKHGKPAEEEAPEAPAEEEGAEEPKAPAEEAKAPAEEGETTEGEAPAEEEEATEAKAPADEEEPTEAKAPAEEEATEAKAPAEEEEATEAKAPAEEEEAEAKAPAEEEESTEAKAPAKDEEATEAKAPAEEDEAKAPAEEEEPAEEAPAEEEPAKVKSLSALKGLLDTLGLNQLRGSK